MQTQTDHAENASLLRDALAVLQATVITLIGAPSVLALMVGVACVG